LGRVRRDRDWEVSELWDRFISSRVEERGMDYRQDIDWFILTNYDYSMDYYYSIILLTYR
jgi:hypothetical protein